MKKKVQNAILASAVLLWGCNPNDQPSRIVTKCPPALVQQRDIESRAAEIVVVGRWDPLKSNIGLSVGLEVGKIRVSKTLRGNLQPDTTVGIVTGDISDPQGKLVQCGLREPSRNEDFIFFIKPGQRALHIIDYRSSIEG